MPKNLNRILLASVATVAFAGTGAFERRRSRARACALRGINATNAQLLLFGILLFISSATTAAAADMPGISLLP